MYRGNTQSSNRVFFCFQNGAGSHQLNFSSERFQPSAFCCKEKHPTSVHHMQTLVVLPDVSFGLSVYLTTFFTLHPRVVCVSSHPLPFIASVVALCMQTTTAAAGFIADQHPNARVVFEKSWRVLVILRCYRWCVLSCNLFPGCEYQDLCVCVDLIHIVNRLCTVPGTGKAIWWTWCTSAASIRGAVRR